jgi:hypothetical protein
LEGQPETRTALDSLDAQHTKISVTRIAYNGWPDCCLIANDSVEAIVVPAIGRVMQFRIAGVGEGAFWENRAMDGQLPDSNEWINFGGDKCWPAPQSAWLWQQGRDWPPPVAFDALPVEAVVCEGGVALTSPVDQGFGIQVTRNVELDPKLPVMRIRTEFRKVAGEPVKVSVWTITQMREPERVFVPLRKKSKMPGGFVRLIDAEPEGLRIEGGLLSLARHPAKCIKIGADATSLICVGPASVIRIDAEDGPGEYPDGGCIVQVYTNPNPMPYVELETLGPLAAMSAGDRIERTTVYTIMPRSVSDPKAEARRLLQK